MSDTTPIEWTDSTWNVVGGCSIESPGCINCYAQKLCGTRLKHHPLYAGTTDIVKGKPVFNGELTVRHLDHPSWTWPLRWRGAKKPLLGPGEPSTIFVGDMSDLFHERRPLEVIDRIIAVLLLSNHIGQLLTKRAYIADEYFADPGTPKRVERLMDEIAPEHWCRRELQDVGGWPNSRIWVGCSVERQKEADARREYMSAIAERGWLTYVSYEPAIGPIDWTGWEFLHQIISGGESGKYKPRLTHPDWHRATRDFCEARAIAYLFKQWGEFSPIDVREGPDHVDAWLDDMAVYRIDHGIRRAYMRLVGKKAAGRLLDGREWNELPRVSCDAPATPALAEHA